MRADYERLRAAARAPGRVHARARSSACGPFPGVTGAASARDRPLGGDGWNEHISVEGTDVQRTVGQLQPRQPGLLPDHGDVPARRPGLRRRATRAGSEPVAIVTETFARKFLGGGNPIGRTFQVDNQGGDTVRRFRIVGLVRDSKYGELREDFTPIVYLLDAQDHEPRPWTSDRRAVGAAAHDAAAVADVGRSRA